MRICLIDLSGVFRAAWHASEHEELSSAFNRTVSTVTASSAGYDAVAVCCDRPPYKRKELSPTYKAHREAAPAAMYEQLRAVEEQLGADGYHIVGADGYEADDCIATLCEWAKAQKHEVDVFSADKDLLALVGQGVSVISTATRAKYSTADDVQAKLGIGPHQITDWLALAGDKSDGIPGVPGCGAKTAAKWLNEIGDLTAILADVDKLPERFRSIVAANREQLGLSWKLAQLMTAPIDCAAILEPKERKQSPRATATKITAEEDEEMPEPEIVEAAKQEPDAPTSVVTGKPIVNSNTAIATVPWDTALEPRGPAQAWQIAQTLYASRLFGAFPNAEAIMAIVMTGREMGLGAVTSLRSFHLIEGKACPHSHLLIGLVMKSPLCEYFTMIQSDDKSATYETRRKGHQEPVRLTYTFEQAHAAGLDRPTKSGKPSNWHSRPDEMIRKTCGVQLARAVYPDVTMGLYSAEEMGAEP